jgi:hypothetical protein
MESLDPLELALSGGDDYELLFTAPEEAAGALDAHRPELGVPVTRIGRVESGRGAVLRDGTADGHRRSTRPLQRAQARPQGAGARVNPGERDRAARAKRSLRRRALKVLLRLMRREESLERVAAAVAVGVGVGLSPFIGFHYFLTIAIALIFRLNKLDTVLGSLVGNPWTLPPFYALGYRLGRAILGFAPARVPPLRWQRILHHDFWV